MVRSDLDDRVRCRGSSAVTAALSEAAAFWVLRQPVRMLRLICWFVYITAPGSLKIQMMHKQHVVEEIQKLMDYEEYMEVLVAPPSGSWSCPAAATTWDQPGGHSVFCSPTSCKETKAYQGRQVTKEEGYRQGEIWSICGGDQANSSPQVWWHWQVPSWALQLVQPPTGDWTLRISPQEWKLGALSHTKKWAVHVEWGEKRCRGAWGV